MRRIVIAACLASTIAIQASAQLIGSGTGANLFPFGGNADVGTIYQQVYAASDFSGSGNLTEIRFFVDPNYPGALRSGTYDLYVSTTLAPVSGLSISDFDSNRGVDNTLFGSFTLSGAAPSTLSFLGSAFFYDPTAGNLLLDFRISGGSGGGAGFKANNGDAGGVFSRAHNFGTSFTDWGLQTEFVFGEPNTTVPEPATMTLLATGLAGMAAARRKRRQ